MSSDQRSGRPARSMPADAMKAFGDRFGFQFAAHSPHAKYDTLAGIGETRSAHLGQFGTPQTPISSCGSSGCSTNGSKY